MFSRRIPSAQKRCLLREALRPDAPATLICANNGTPASRVLVLDNAGSLDEGFLRTAAELCRSLQLTPVVLSVAGSERTARQRQQAAFRAFAGFNAEARFDYLVGCEVRSAVTQIASWRRCQMVMGQHEACAPWWRWLRDTTVEELMGVLESLSFMALSEANRRTVPRGRMQTDPPVLAQTLALVPHSRIGPVNGLAPRSVEALRSANNS